MTKRIIISPAQNYLEQSGIALITVLLLLVFVLVIVGGLFYRHQIHLQKVGHTLVGDQAMLLLLGAESWTQDLLLEDNRMSAIDHLGEKWARNLPVLPVEGALLTGCLHDLHSMFNINSLGWYTNKSWDDELKAEHQKRPVTTYKTIYRALLQQQELNDSDQRIASVVDWIDPDSWLVSPDSAEDNEYLLFDPPYRAANFPLGDLSELSLVNGYTAVDVLRLSPFVTTIGEPIPINVNTASIQLLSALSPLISIDDATALAELRPFNNLEEFYNMLSQVISETKDNLRIYIPANLLSVNSRYFSLQADISLAGQHMAYSSIIVRQGMKAANVLSRSVSFIPNITDRNGKKISVSTRCEQQEAPTSS